MANRVYLRSASGKPLATSPDPDFVPGVGSIFEIRPALDQPAKVKLRIVGEPRHVYVGRSRVTYIVAEELPDDPTDSKG